MAAAAVNPGLHPIEYYYNLPLTTAVIIGNQLINPLNNFWIPILEDENLETPNIKDTFRWAYQQMDDTQQIITITLEDNLPFKKDISGLINDVLTGIRSSRTGKIKNKVRKFAAKQKILSHFVNEQTPYRPHLDTLRGLCQKFNNAVASMEEIRGHYTHPVNPADPGYIKSANINIPIERSTTKRQANYRYERMEGLAEIANFNGGIMLYGILMDILKHNIRSEENIVCDEVLVLLLQNPKNYYQIFKPTFTMGNNTSAYKEGKTSAAAQSAINGQRQNNHEIQVLRNGSIMKSWTQNGGSKKKKKSSTKKKKSSTGIKRVKAKNGRIMYFKNGKQISKDKALKKKKK